MASRVTIRWNGIDMDRGAAGVVNGVFRATMYLAGQLRRTVLQTFKGRTGELARSYRETFFGTQGKVTRAGVYSDLSYAGIQDEGGVVLPRTARALAIPLPRANVPYGKWPRDYARGALFVSQRRGKLPVLRDAQSKKPLYVLVPQTRIEGRHYLQATVDVSWAKVQQIAADQLSLAIKREPAT